MHQPAVDRSRIRSPRHPPESFLPAMPNSTSRDARRTDRLPRKLPGSTICSIRSRAVSLPSMLLFDALCPPPTQLCALRAGRSPSAMVFAESFLLGHPCSCILSALIMTPGLLCRRNCYPVRLSRSVSHHKSLVGAPDLCRCPVPSPARRCGCGRLRVSDPCPDSSGPASRVEKNLGATCGNMAKVSTSSSEPLQPGNSSAASRKSCHSGFRRSAGRHVIGALPACASASFDHFRIARPIVSP